MNNDFKEGETIFVPSYNMIETKIIRIFDKYYTCDHWSCRDGPSYWTGLEAHSKKEAFFNLIEYLKKEYL